MLWRRFRARQAANSVLDALRVHWATLPGATLMAKGVHVHDGDRPLNIFLSHASGVPMRARIATPIGALPMAFRLWPKELPPPELTPDGSQASTRQLERSAVVESWLAGHFRAESNDEERFSSLIDTRITSALLTLVQARGGELEGLTYDGQSLTVALRGAVVADPERSLQMARILWRPFVP